MWEDLLSTLLRERDRIVGKIRGLTAPVGVLEGPLAVIVRILGVANTIMYVRELLLFTCFLLEEAAQIVSRLALKYTCPNVDHDQLRELRGRVGYDAGVGLVATSMLQYLSLPDYQAFRHYFMACDELTKLIDRILNEG